MSTKHSLEQIVNVAKEIYRNSTLNDCFFEIFGNRLMLQSIWSQIDLEKNERIKFQKPYFFEVDHSQKVQLLHIGQSQPIRNDIWNVKSPNNLLNAILTTWKENGEDRQFLEIWKDDVKTENLNLTKLEKHSKVYENSSCLGSFVWSSDSTKIAYVAEIKNTNKEKSFFTSKISTENDCLNENNYEEKYANYHRDEWGEQYVGKSQSTIALYDLETKDLKVLENLPEDFAPATLTWYDNKGLVFNAYYTKPYRLGLIYCPIRKSELFYYDLLEKKCTQLTNYESENLRDPKFSNDFQNLVWLQNQARGPHFQCSKLMIMNWKTKEIKTVLDIVDQPKNSNDFPGLFAVNLTKNCWSSDNKRLILDSQWLGRNRIILVDIEQKTVINLNNGIGEVDSLNVLKIQNDWICGVLQSYNKRPSLVLAKLPEKGQEENINWFLTKESDSLIEKASIELLDFKPTIPDTIFPKLNFQSIFVQAKNKNDTLVIFPHGGPHSAYGCEYSPHVAVMYSLGYSILLINYRGSSGFGQNSIDSLPGKIGTNDVNDCQQAAEFLKSKYGFKNAVLYGGSHGGYLTAQLIGQFPDFYSAAAARNPVTHLETMLFTSDIPDWIICEGLGEYDYDFKIGGCEIPKKLFEKSPMCHVNKVKTPTLLMMGNVDLRVPCTQSIEYYKALKSRNVPVKLLSYKEDNHPLEKPHTTADCIIHTLLWYEKYID
ncbi:unnamed protein product [Brachionus calyciflorus]|uniref:acylaminoacyl-peptidase n=1 Tax=Brachionus calyciflorus TaxID=104777 RepID=A0A813QL52_9BILA|nr:unnamed protein product [Brachionus calyciflorus]